MFLMAFRCTPGTYFHVGTQLLLIILSVLLRAINIIARNVGLRGKVVKTLNIIYPHKIIQEPQETEFIC